MSNISISAHQLALLAALAARVAASTDRKFRRDEHFDTLANSLNTPHLGAPMADVYDIKGERFLRLFWTGTPETEVCMEILVGEQPGFGTSGPYNPGPNPTPPNSGATTPTTLAS